MLLLLLMLLLPFRNSIHKLLLTINQKVIVTASNH